MLGTRTYFIAFTVVLLLQVFQGSKNAFDSASYETLYLDGRALRFIIAAYVGQPCMRVETWGVSK